ncbi:hypothetical protein K9N50_08165 [bacterium]|nr:hypothetical protein [bacterium]
MRLMNRLYSKDEGWTFVEAMLAVVIMAIMVLGLTVMLMAFREHLDRSWAVRTMDQYGNDVVERLTHSLRNGINVQVNTRINNYSIKIDDIDVTALDPMYLDDAHAITNRWRVNTRAVQVYAEEKPKKSGLNAVDPLFPPKRLGRGEYFEIKRFTLSEYGKDRDSPDGSIWENERLDSWSRSETFKEATYLIRFVLAYHRNAINAGDKSWDFEKEYNNRVYMRNKNLPIRKSVEAGQDQAG